MDCKNIDTYVGDAVLPEGRQDEPRTLACDARAILPKFMSAPVIPFLFSLPPSKPLRYRAKCVLQPDAIRVPGRVFNAHHAAKLF